MGESGSGKTTVGLALLGHTRRGVRVAHGRISVTGHEMLSLPPEQRRVLRGAVVSYVPQDPGSALNPNLRIGKQIFEVLAYHDIGDDASRHRRVAESLAEVALPSNNEFLRRYPHQLSGGQQQRVGLAMAFACRPRVLVLDEPTTGLDVTTQAHVLGTVRDLCGQHGVAALYVSHDLAVISDLADRVALMYAGRLVEVGPKVSFFQGSAHPYARRLIEAIPEMSGDHELLGIPGSAPRPGQRPDGCFFAPRCNWVDDVCHTAFPPRVELADDHEVRCYRYQEVLAAARAERISARDRVQIPETADGAPLSEEPERLVRPAAGAPRHQPGRRAGRVRRPRRRVGVGQDDAGALHRRPAPRPRRRDPAERRSPSHRARGRAVARCASRSSTSSRARTRR